MKERVRACHLSNLNIYILMWVPVSYGPDNKYDTRRRGSWVSSVIRVCRVSHYAVDKERPHQSPCPPTLSLGMMRSSEPCFKNTFPANTGHSVISKITLYWMSCLIWAFF